MDRATSLRVNSPRVIHELFEGEVVVVNLDTGRYYSLQQTSAEAWRHLADGRSPGDVIDMLRGQYLAEPDQIEQSVDQFVDDLLRDGLLIPAARTSPTVAATPDATRPAAQLPFVPLRVQVFTDMQDLLLLDPIHEVDTEGWPLARAPQPGIEPAK